jgi:hypothetical protein
MPNPLSDSTPQQLAGEALIETLAVTLRIPLEQRKRLSLNDNCVVEIDGYSHSKAILCEAYAHYGKLRGSQTDKVMQDVMKLLFVERSLKQPYRKIILFCDEDARLPFISNSWQAQCLTAFNIETLVCPLPHALENGVREAQ